MSFNECFTYFQVYEEMLLGFYIFLGQFDCMTMDNTLNWYIVKTKMGPWTPWLTEKYYPVHGKLIQPVTVWFW